MIAISLPFWLSGNRNNSGQGCLFPGSICECRIDLWNSVRLTVADIDVPSPSQILFSIDGARQVRVADTLRSKQLPCLKSSDTNEPFDLSVRSELSMMKLTQDLELA